MGNVGKEDLRAQSLAARRGLSDATRRAEADQLIGHLAEVVGAARVVAAYVPVGTEPGKPEMLDTLSQLCETVLLPVTGTGPEGEPQPLRWGRYQPGRLAAGRFGLSEPAGPSLPPAALARAKVVLVPALAVDRRGGRLGRGGGFYDRSLPMCAPGTRLVAVVRDSEFVDELPCESHDVPMTHALTPGGGLHALRECPAPDDGSGT